LAGGKAADSSKNASLLFKTYLCGIDPNKPMGPVKTLCCRIWKKEFNMEQTALEKIIDLEKDQDLRQIGHKIAAKVRIDEVDGVRLFEKASLAYVGALANWVRESLHGNKTYFNRNFHIEPTNVCVFSCQFCSYSRLYAHREEGWELSMDQMLNIVKSYDGKPVTEVHIVGGVHPKMNLEFFMELMRKIKAHRPEIHIKGFTAVELDYMFRKAKLSVEEGLAQMHQAGLDSLPGGGAEIFHPEIRNQICADKVDADGWLHIHRAAHLLGMHSNATMLFGHIEGYQHRVDHMQRLRKLQDETHGFNTFIPLKFRHKDNDMSYIPESSVVEDMKLYAISRLYMDNFPHLKAYWPMLGRQNAQLSLSFGVNDLDGTIDDSTRIYSMAGSEEQHPSLSTTQLVTLIRQVKREPVERDTLYKEINNFKDVDLTELALNPALN
jgi:aminodeoxyfutalosine synthase